MKASFKLKMSMMMYVCEISVLIVKVLHNFKFTSMECGMLGITIIAKKWNTWY